MRQGEPLLPFLFSVVRELSKIEKTLSETLGKETSWAAHGILVLITYASNYPLTLHLLMSSADNLCKQIGPRSGPTKRRA